MDIYRKYLYTCIYQFPLAVFVGREKWGWAKGLTPLDVPSEYTHKHISPCTKIISRYLSLLFQFYFLLAKGVGWPESEGDHSFASKLGTWLHWHDVREWSVCDLLALRTNKNIGGSLSAGRTISEAPPSVSLQETLPPPRWSGMTLLKCPKLYTYPDLK